MRSGPISGITKVMWKRKSERRTSGFESIGFVRSRNLRRSKFHALARQPYTRKQILKTRVGKKTVEVGIDSKPYHAPATKLVGFFKPSEGLISFCQLGVERSDQHRIPVASILLRKREFKVFLSKRMQPVSDIQFAQFR